MEQRHGFGERSPHGTERPEFKLLIENNADGIVVIDEGGIVLFANPAAERMFGRPAAELIGAPIGVPIIAGETTEISLVRPNGETIETEIRVVGAEDGSGGPADRRDRARFQ
jgi:PAS domain S-box-containing protein